MVFGNVEVKINKYLMRLRIDQEQFWKYPTIAYIRSVFLLIVKDYKEKEIDIGLLGEISEHLMMNKTWQHFFLDVHDGKLSSVLLHGANLCCDKCSGIGKQKDKYFQEFIDPYFTKHESFLKNLLLQLKNKL